MATNPTPSRRRRQEAVFTLVWSGDDVAEPTYDGLAIAVPPSDKIANPGAPNSPYRYPAAKDDQGPIPGTVVLESLFVHNHNTGGVDAEFDAAGWCNGIDSTDSGKKLMARGLYVYDGAVTRDEVETLQREGRVKWEAAQEAQWNQTLALEMTRRDKLKQQNRPLTAAPNEKAIRDAIVGLERLRVSRVQKLVSDDAIRGALGFAKPEPTPASVTPFPVPKVESGSELRDLGKVLLTVAHKHNVRLTNAETMGLFEKDEAVLMSVQKKLTENGVDLEAEVGRA